MLDLACRTKFHMRQVDAAKSLGISVSALQHACRQLGVLRWPWRDRQQKTGVPDSGTSKSLEKEASERPREESRWHSENWKSQMVQCQPGDGGSAVLSGLHSVRLACMAEPHSQRLQKDELLHNDDGEGASRASGSDCDDLEGVGAGVPLLRSRQHEIWQKCNSHHNGLLDEAMNFL